MFLALAAGALAVSARAVAPRVPPAAAMEVCVGLLGAILVVALAARRQSSPPRGAVERGIELARMAALVFFAVWAFRPYLSPAFFGGMDATSYAYGMSDALQQERAGTFPVFVGQSEFMFEGVIHPIRTAPYHHYLGMLLDVLTLRTFEPVAIEHLTVIFSAMLAALTAYACLAELAPARRWAAWIIAGIYVSAPAMAGFIYTKEMYMTFMAFAWLPLVLYANLRLIRRDDRTGWSLLAAGTMLLWVCHPPIGLWATLLSGLLQGWRLGEPRPMTLLVRAAGGAALFAVLGAYYFWSMGETAAGGPVAIAGGGANLPVFAGLIIGFALLLRSLATRNLAWPGLALLVAGVLWFLFRPYALWLATAALLTVAWKIATARFGTHAWGRRLPEISLGLALLAGLCVLPWCPQADAIPAYTILRGLFPGNFAPLSATGTLPGDLQLGYPVLALWLLGISAAALTDRLEVRLPALAGLVGMALVVPVPGITRLFMAMMPEFVTAISSVSLWQRYLPVLLALSVFLGFLGLETWAGSRRKTGWILLLLVAAGAAWSARENEKFVRGGYRAMHSTGEHRDLNRPENVRQFAYIFSRLPVSPYLLNGVADYHLESRLLRADGSGDELGETVPWPKQEWQTLTATPDELNARFLNVTPGFTLAPGEHRLLKFRFLNRRYEGVLIMRGAGAWYREYLFPEAGFGPKSFGVAPERPKTLAVWNSSSGPQPVELVFLLPYIPTEKMPPEPFAELAMTTYDPAQLPIRTTSLIPYRAEVSAPGPAFLETPRMFIPGYRATVNGHPQAALMSPNQRVMVPVSAGENRVTLKYVGTPSLLTALAVSGVAWLVLLLWAAGEWARRGA